MRRTTLQAPELDLTAARPGGRDRREAVKWQALITVVFEWEHSDLGGVASPTLKTSALSDSRFYGIAASFVSRVTAAPVMGFPPVISMGWRATASRCFDVGICETAATGLRVTSRK